MNWELFVIFVLASAAAGSTGVLFPPGSWYDSLRRPEFTPPRWGFPVIWTALYLMSSLAASRVAPLAGSGLAMAFWALQIACNTLWTPVFFGLHLMRLALGVMAVLWVAVAGMLFSFWQLDSTAAALVAPYLVWVTIAGALNLRVWQLNPGA